jgi:hypothetical protein
MKYLRNNLAQIKQWILSIVSTRLSFKEIGELADKWLEDEIAKDPEDKFTDSEKYWMIEGFIEGYKKAQNGC